MPRERSPEGPLFPAALGALGLLYAALLARGASALANLEAPELDATARALVFVVAPVAALLGVVIAARGSRRANLLTLVAGAIAGAVSALAPIASNLAHLSAARALRAADLAQLGYAGAAAVLGIVFALPALVAIRGVLALGARGRLALGAIALAAAALLLATRPRPIPPEAVLAARPASTAPPEKQRGPGEPEESPFLKHRRAIAQILDELAAEMKAGRPGEVERVILEAQAHELLSDVFASAVEQGLYDALEKHLRDLPRESPALAAMIAARPRYGADELNADALADIRARRDWSSYPYPLLIVPGFTPVKAKKPLAVEDIPAAKQRLDCAYDDWKKNLAPYIFVSGGAVHPAGTPHNEALSMRDYLLKRGVPAERILVDPFARHSTTNLRNAGRLMREYNMKHALIVTGFESSPFDQAFYFANPILSTFASRSRRELGFLVGKLNGIDGHHVDFVPADEVATINPFDPLDA